MTLLRTSLLLLLLTTGFSLQAAVPAPAFTAAQPNPTGGQTVVNLVGSKTVPKLESGVDLGKDQVLPLNLSGHAGAWDVVSADHDSKSVSIRVQATTPGVSYTVVNLATTGFPSDVAVADVSYKTATTDDIITVEDGVIRIYTNTRAAATPGNPTFAAPISLTATATDASTLHINKIAIADFNQDGQPDIVGVGTIVVAGVNQVQVAVFLSNAISPGVPSFQNATVYTATGSRATGDLVAVGNLTSNLTVAGHPAIDPYPEIVVAGSNGDVPAAGGGSNGSGYGNFYVFYNKGNGTFGNDGDAVVPPYLGNSFHHIHALAIGDTNSDGHRDVVMETSNIFNGQTLVNVYGGNDLGQPGGTVNGVSFNAATFLGVNTDRAFQGALAIGDLNADGIPDIASVLDTDGLHIIAMPAIPDNGSNSPGANGFLYQLGVGTGARSLAITDADRDGNSDLAITNTTTAPFRVFVNRRGGGTTTATAPSMPTATPASPHFGQVVTITSNYATTVASTRLTFQRKGLDNKWVTMGSALGVQGVFTYKIATLPTGIYSFRASAVIAGKVTYSPESLAFTVGLATPTITGISGGTGNLPTKITIKEAGIPGSILTSGLSFTLQSSQDGTAFTDVPSGTAPNQNITISGTNGTYIVTVKTLPTDAPYFRVVAHLDSQNDITSPIFSLFAVDATIAQVTNDTSAADDTTQVVKTGAALGTNVINPTGLSQTKTVRIAWGDFQTYAIRFKNLSKFLESVSVTGPTGNSDFEVRYFASAGTAQAPLIGADITMAVTTSGCVGDLPAGATGTIYVRARTYPGTMRANVINLPITIGVVGDPSRRDVVKLTVSATNALKTAFVTNGGPTGEGTLFAAITYANAHPGTTIEFEVPADDAHWTTYNGKPLLKIPCTTQLPAITATGTVIDGTSQRELPDQVYSPTLPAICLVGYGIPEASNGQDQPHETGLDIEAANCSVRALMITRFATGISLYGPKAINNSVFECTFIGNTNIGVSIENHATKNLIGGAGNGHNIFRALHEGSSYYSNYGVAITGHSNSNKVQGNYFGVTEAGAPEPNQSYGFLQSAVYIEKSSEANLIGGTTNGSGNLISGNPGAQPTSFSVGVEIRSSNNIVQGNLIGLTLAGDAANGNGVGVLITIGVDDQNPPQPKVTDGNVIGSTELHGSNVISGNQIGIKSTAGVEHTRIYGNYIGTNINALSAVPNIIGIRMHGYDSTIGGNTAAYRNVISGNSDDGILLDFDAGFAEFTNNVVYGNYIGVNGINSGPLPNGANGVETFSGGNTVGDSGPGLANVIANNTQAGVLLNGPSNLENTIRANSMYNNGGLAIDVAPTNAAAPDGVTANDSNEADGFQNYPVLTGATKVLNRNSYKLSGSLQSLPSQNYVLDAYLTDAPDGSGHGEGKVYLGSVKLKSDATGHILFAVDLPIPAAGLPASGKYVSMTATQLITQSGATFFSGTSEFSNAVTLP